MIYMCTLKNNSDIIVLSWVNYSLHLVCCCIYKYMFHFECCHQVYTCITNESDSSIILGRLVVVRPYQPRQPPSNSILHLYWCRLHVSFVFSFSLNA